MRNLITGGFSHGASLLEDAVRDAYASMRPPQARLRRAFRCAFRFAVCLAASWLGRFSRMVACPTSHISGVTTGRYRGRPPELCNGKVYEPLELLVSPIGDITQSERTIARNKGSCRHTTATARLVFSRLPSRANVKL